MFLSALTLAAVLQAAPAPAAPITGQRGYLLQRRPFDASQSMDVRNLPMPMIRGMTPEEARAAGKQRNLPRPPAKARREMVARPAGFVLNGVLCGRRVLEHAGHPETLEAQPLNELPGGRLEYAVARTVDGCPVAAPVAQGGLIR